MKNQTIIPTVFAHTKKEFKARYKKLKTITKALHIDFMDGKFVPTRSMRVSDIPPIDTKTIQFSAHLMVQNPGRYILQLKKKGFSQIIFHYESLKQTRAITKIIDTIHNHHMKALIALNPTTKPENIFPFITNIDGILCMGVQPGKEKQPLHPRVYTTIRTIKKHSPKTMVQVDGGVNEKTIHPLKKAGANKVNTGSYVSSSDNPKKALAQLTRLF